MIRIAIVIIAICLAGAPLQAQIASVSVFGPMPAASVSEADGFKTTTESDFALYELGRWHPGIGSDAAPAGMDARGLLTSAPAIHEISVNCGTSGQAPPRQLSARALVGRRIFWPLIANAECRYGLPPGLMDSVVLAESRYNPAVVSPAGAAGLAQLMPGTAMDLGVIDRFNPTASVQAGARYLRQLLDTFDGNIPLALAAYNAGPGTIRHVKGIPVNGETPDYVRRVLAYWTAPGIGPMSPVLSARQTAQVLGFSPTATN